MCFCVYLKIKYKSKDKKTFLTSQNESISANDCIQSKNLFAKSSVYPCRRHSAVIMILERAQVRAKMMAASNSALADELSELAALTQEGLRGVAIANFLCRLIQHFFF